MDRVHAAVRSDWLDAHADLKLHCQDMTNVVFGSINVSTYNALNSVNPADAEDIGPVWSSSMPFAV